MTFIFYRCEHWDVYNEYLQGDFFEKTTDNPWIINRMFKRMNASDPGALHTLNEDIVAKDPGTHTIVCTNYPDN